MNAAFFHFYVSKLLSIDPIVWLPASLATLPYKRNSGDISSEKKFLLSRTVIDKTSAVLQSKMNWKAKWTEGYIKAI